MKKFLVCALGLILFGIAPNRSMAEVNISIGIGLPPPIIFSEPPSVIVIPDTNYVYAVPDIDMDLFFWNGWWWRLWEGRWYRSQYYNRGWRHYGHVPRFYYDVDPGWRGYYRERNWYGHRWDYRRIPSRQLHQNWRSWNKNRYWDNKRRTWGVQNYQARPPQQRQELRIQRRQQYQQRPDVQRYQQQRPPHGQQPQQQYRQNRGGPERGSSPRNYEGRGAEHRR